MEPDALRETAALASMPEVEAALSPSALEAKPMPDIAAPGRRVGFDLRLRPVVRLARNIASAGRIGERQPGFRKGAEIDVFLAEALSYTENDVIEAAGRMREVVYRDWLAARLGHAADLDEARLAAFRRTVTLRGGHAREGPDAVMQGPLTIRDPDAFADILRRGVGRHKAYGYGMLLLRPPGAPVPQR